MNLTKFSSNKIYWFIASFQRDVINRIFVCEQYFDGSLESPQSYCLLCKSFPSRPIIFIPISKIYLRFF